MPKNEIHQTFIQILVYQAIIMKIASQNQNKSFTSVSSNFSHINRILSGNDYHFFNSQGFVQRNNSYIKYFQLESHNFINFYFDNPNYSNCSTPDKYWFKVDDLPIAKIPNYISKINHKSLGMILIVDETCAQNLTFSYYSVSSDPIFDNRQRISFIPIKTVIFQKMNNCSLEWGGDILNSFFKDGNNNYQICKSKPETKNILQRNIYLSNHTSIEFLIKVYAYNKQQINITIDDQQYYFNFQEDFQIKIFDCADYYLTQIEISEFQHTSTNLNITITLDNSAPVAISDFQLILRDIIIQQRIYLNCLDVIQEKCWNCFDYFRLDKLTNECIPICGDKIIVSFEECDDGNSDPYDGCHYCKFQCLLNCEKCVFGKCEQYKIETIENNIYQKILEGYISGYYYYDKIFSPIKSICGDGILQLGEDCDDGNQLQYDGCFNCKFSCPLKCKHCEYGLCKQFEVEEGEVVFEQNFCKEFSILESSGYYFDIYNYICQPICGDGIVTRDEQCDDGNQITNDGCYNCKFSCSLHCLKCKDGQCMQCFQGYRLRNKKCTAICGDGVIEDMEYCDDGNTAPFDGCSNCEQSCQIQCLDCQGNTCYSCLEGWMLINGKCFQICGDNQIAVTSYEQCDDVNDQNCQDCKYLCPQYCLKCFNPYSCFVCQDGYKIVENLCIPDCGDGIVIKNYEDCDDENQIQFDGCYQCHFQCDDGCLDCVGLNICRQCDEQSYQLDLETKICIQIPEEIIPEEQIIKIVCEEFQQLINGECKNSCGNGILNIIIEECDDGNDQGGDGCSKFCNVENQYICKSKANSLSVCTYQKSPSFILENLSQKKESKQIVKLSFDQEVHLITQVDLLNLLILSVQPKEEQNISFTAIVDLNTSLMNSTFLIETIFKSSTSNPQLTVRFNENIEIVNQFEIKLGEYNKSINLGQPFFLAQSELQNVNSVVQLNDAILYGIVAISGFSILLGNFDIFLNALELLQQLSYLQYIYYDYPPNLQEFFKIYKKVQISSLINELGIDKIFAKLNKGIIPFKSQKNSNLNITPLNQYFLINAKACYMALISSFITYLICSGITSMKFQSFLLNLLARINLKLSSYQSIYNKIIKISNICQKVKSTYFYTGLYTVYFSCYHQLSFSIFLQFPQYSFDSLFEIANSITSIMFSVIFITILYFGFQYTQLINYKCKQLSFYFNGINNNFWSLQFKAIQMLKTTSYLAIIVFFMDFPELQSFILSIQSLTFTLYIVQNVPLKSKLELIQLLIKELLFSLLTGSFFAYSFNFDNQKLMMLGWIHIGILSSILVSNLLIDSVKQFQQLKLIYQREQTIKRLKLELKFYVNPLQEFIADGHRKQQMLSKK